MKHALSDVDVLHASPRIVTPASAHPVLDAGTQQFLDMVAEAGLSPDTLLFQPRASCNATPRDGVSAKRGDVVGEDLVLPTGSTGAIHVRIMRPRKASASLPAVLYFPGGGWRMTDRTLHEALARRLALEAGVAIVCVENARAATLRYPARNEEAYSALMHIVTHATSLSIDSRRIAIAGDGMGANIAAALTLMVRSRRGPALAFQLLFYPIVSANETTDSFRQFAEGPGMSAHAMRAAILDQFAIETLSDALAMPLNATQADLEGLPPALIVTAENDVMRDAAEAYARNLMRAGVEVTASRYLGTVHDFVVLAGLAETPPARAAIAQACSALQSALRDR